MISTCLVLSETSSLLQNSPLYPQQYNIQISYVAHALLISVLLSLKTNGIEYSSCACLPSVCPFHVFSLILLTWTVCTLIYSLWFLIHTCSLPWSCPFHPCTSLQSHIYSPHYPLSYTPLTVSQSFIFTLTLEALCFVLF